MDKFIDDGTFEPDYILILIKDETQEQQQIFIEPKGEGFIETDKWKQDLLESLDTEAVVDYSGEEGKGGYTVIGLPFYNETKPQALSSFENAFDEKVLSS